MMWLRTAVLTVLVGLLLCGPAKAQTAAPIQLAETDGKALSRQIESIYKGLILGGQFPVYRYTVERGDTVEGVMRRASGYAGSYFPVTLDSITCDLNFLICRRNLVPAPDTVSARSRQARLRSILQIKPSYGNWNRLNAGDTIFLPRLRIQTTQSTRVYNKKRGQSLETIIRATGACSDRERTSCLEEIDFLNAKSAPYESSDYEGELLLPELEYHIIIPDSCDPVCAQVRFFDVDFAGNKFLSPPFVFGEETGKATQKFTTEQLLRVEDLLGTNVSDTLKSLRTIELPKGISIKSNHETEEFHSEQVDLLRTHNYPFEKIHQNDVGFPTQVMVIDKEFDNDHCEFDQGNLVVYDCSNRESVVSNVELCPLSTGIDQSVDRQACDDPGLIQIEEIEISHQSAVELRHGTHIAGIIAAKHDHNGTFFGTAGINPQAKIIGVKINTDLLINDGEYALALRNKLFSLIREERVGIVNFSFGYLGEPPTNADEASSRFGDPILDLMNDLKKRTLFVVPAGNNNDDNLGICKLMPACAADVLENVLSVIALDNHEKSIFARAGNARFAIGAIGKNVLAPSVFNKFTRLDGSSQSVAVVSGAASLADTFGARWTPKKYIDRFIACSKLLAGWDDSQSLGGSLDITCILEFERDRVTTSTKVTTGELTIVLGGADSHRLQFDDTENGVLLTIPLDQIVGFQQVNGDPTDIVLYHRRNTQSELKRIRGRFVQGSNVRLRIEQNGVKDDIPLDDILQFVHNTQ
ncbi:MAG: S8 family serine peptidase [Hyphomicrobiales bacterium]